ncbi:hypothetical protein ACWC3X_41665, partial [Streptomyces populi]
MLALLVVPFTVLAAAPAQAVPPDRTSFLTWNMQGSTSSGQSLWSDYIKKIIERARFPEVVMLQEVGPGVPTSTPLGDPPGIEDNPLVTYVRWHMSTTQNYYMVFLQTNDRTRPGGRVNTIVMSRTRPDEAMVVENGHSSDAARPAIGIRLGSDWYFSFHALSRSSGPDGVPMLNSIGSAVLDNAQAAARRDGTPVQRRDWTVGADFNRRPTTTGTEPGLQQQADWPRII